MNEKQLVGFGNYLLSKQREKSILNKNNLKKVHDSDIQNYLVSLELKSNNL